VDTQIHLASTMLFTVFIQTPFQFQLATSVCSLWHTCSSWSLHICTYECWHTNVWTHWAARVGTEAWWTEIFGKDCCETDISSVLTARPDLSGASSSQTRYAVVYNNQWSSQSVRVRRWSWLVG